MGSLVSYGTVNDSNTTHKKKIAIVKSNCSLSCLVCSLSNEQSSANNFLFISFGFHGGGSYVLVILCAHSYICCHCFVCRKELLITSRD